jgi:hypothetical protein
LNASHIAVAKASVLTARRKHENSGRIYGRKIGDRQGKEVIITKDQEIDDGIGDIPLNVCAYQWRNQRAVVSHLRAQGKSQADGAACQQKVENTAKKCDHKLAPVLFSFGQSDAIWLHGQKEDKQDNVEDKSDRSLAHGKRLC